MTSLNPSRERNLLWLLALTQFTIIMDFMVMMPLGPQIMRAFQISPALFATAVSAYSWCSGLSGLFAATYIDRFDRRQLLLVVFVLFGLSNLGCALAPNFHVLLAARAFAGLTGGVLASIVMAIVSDVIPAQRRGAATGVVMTSFSLAAVAGVPAGVLLGAHFGWSSPFFLLVILSALICFVAYGIVPNLRDHLSKQAAPLSQVLPDLSDLIFKKAHLKAFLLTLLVMTAHMMIVPFISPVLVANHGIAPPQIAWIYMAGGFATFFTSRLVGRLSDRYGTHRVFCIMAILSIFPVLVITHLPSITLIGALLIFPCFMVSTSGRMIPMQALLSTVPESPKRGAFLSVNSAMQSFGSGCGAWLGGLWLSNTPDNQIIGYGFNGLIATALIIFAIMWVGQVKKA